jgi:hypothetical protein
MPMLVTAEYCTSASVRQKLGESKFKRFNSDLIRYRSQEYCTCTYITDASLSESRPFRFQRQSWQFEGHLQKCVIVDSGITIRVLVEYFERFFKLLHNGARAHKTVKRDSGPSTLASRQSSSLATFRCCRRSSSLATSHCCRRSGSWATSRCRGRNGSCATFRCRRRSGSLATFRCRLSRNPVYV